MYLTITPDAQQRIEQARKRAEGNLALYYESRVGCDCGNTGIFTLQLRKDNSTEMDTMIESNIGELPAQKWSLPFLDEELKLDYKKEKNALVLRGNSGLINNNVLITDEEGKQIL